MSMPETTPAPDLSLRDLAQFAEGQARRLAGDRTKALEGDSAGQHDSRRVNDPELIGQRPLIGLARLIVDRDIGALVREQL